MSVHLATVNWKRSENEAFIDGRYSRVHQWTFDGGVTMDASPSPSVVPAPYSDETCIDPEEAFVVSLSSCHMLFFLQFAAKAGLVVDHYQDEARGVLAANEKGDLVMAEVFLKPKVTVVGDVADLSQVLDSLHHKAHESCFLARSVNCKITIER
ncbi:OsmC family protein [Vibrio sonorensis]|uniref:OsmC family protein n=1 Tax=Vibrio sonorensis TaxID=1004316 RepID=UPI0008DA00D7|nr:OsmC family protein [Vibrio sonorensis]